MKPKVSIIVPCYNAELYIRDCLISALEQDYKNFEVIFVDNESTDNSLSIAESVGKEYSNLIIDQAKNLYRHSWQEPVEKALSLFSGDYFTIVGADDMIDKEYVGKNMSIFEKSPDKIFCLQSPIKGFFRDMKVQKDLILHTYKSLKDFKEKLFTKCPVNTPTVFYSRKLFERGLLKWDSEKFLGAADYNLYFNLADNGVFIYSVPWWLGYKYRWHEKQATWGMHHEERDYNSLVIDFWRNKWEKY
tara:strand:+ start:4129 stop:4866 length:738 start_codon:yes stop_codon:yes gene_type:complete